VTAPAGQQQAPPDSGLTAGQLAQLLILVQAQTAVRHQLTATAVAAVQHAFAGFASWWWNPARVRQAALAALRVVQPAQRQAARTTDVYLTRAVAVMTGRTVGKPAGAVDVTALRKAIPDQIARQLVDGQLRPAWMVLGDTHTGPAADVSAPVRMVLPNNRPPVAAGDQYTRIIDQYRHQIVADGTDETTAADKAMVRLAVAAQTDVTLAVREQVRKTLGPLDITGYRRILHPELSKTGPCGLCVVAADRIYHKADLHPIHNRCVCEVLPIIGSMDPGIQLNYDDLAKIYEAGGGTGGDVVKGGKRHSGALKRIRVAMAEHGEIGPVLVNADQQFRGPRQVAQTVVPDTTASRKAQLAALEKQLVKLRQVAESGRDVTPAIRWHTHRIDQLRSELGVSV
jgi:hypothetical protein